MHILPSILSLQGEVEGNASYQGTNAPLHFLYQCLYSRLALITKISGALRPVTYVPNINVVLCTSHTLY